METLLPTYEPFAPPFAKWVMSKCILLVSFVNSFCFENNEFLCSLGSSFPVEENLGWVGAVWSEVTQTLLPNDLATAIAQRVSIFCYTTSDLVCESQTASFFGIT